MCLGERTMDATSVLAGFLLGQADRSGAGCVPMMPAEQKVSGPTETGGGQSASGSTLTIPSERALSTKWAKVSPTWSLSQRQLNLEPK